MSYNVLLLFIQVFIYDISYYSLIFENRQVGSIFCLYLHRLQHFTSAKAAGH